VLAVIRIRGRVNIDPDIRDTLNQLKLSTKHSCVLLSENETYKGMLKKVENWVAWGPVKTETAKKLIMKRGKINGERITEEMLKKNKVDVSKLLKDVEAGKAKVKDSGINPNFRLGPARGGFKSIIRHYPRGSIGKWPEIDSLLEKMM
jgi:large subunit ribosomal protein L30